MVDRSNDEPVTNIRTFLLAASTAAEKKETVEWFVAFVNFLQDNNLTKRTLLKPRQKPDKSFEIWESDLTDEGVEVVDAAFERWLVALDRGTAPEDVTILERALAKIRK